MRKGSVPGSSDVLREEPVGQAQLTGCCGENGWRWVVPGGGRR